MSHVVKREGASGRPSWRVRWRQDGHYLSETFGSAEDAKRFRGLVDAAGQSYPEGWVPGAGFVLVESEPDAPTLGEWGRRAIASRSRANDRTRGAYLRMLDTHVPPDLLAAPIDTLTREQFGALVIELSATHEAKTVKNIHGLLSSIFNDAVDAGLIARNPMKGLIAVLPDSHREDPVFLTPKEFGAILEATPEHYRPLILFFARTGCRFGEATALSIGQVDLDRGQVRIDRAVKRTAAGTFFVGSTKSRRSRRTITIDATLAEALAPLVADRVDGFVFRTVEGERVSHSNFTNRVWYKVLDTSGLHKRPRIHDLRHTHASWLIAAGVGLPAIQARLGHESITTTIDLYGHLMPDADRDAAAAMARLLD